MRGIRGAGLVAAATLVACAALTSSAGAATITVACGNVTALRNAITTANATTAPDTIEINGAPCPFNVPDAVVFQGSGNTGLPVITQPLTIEGHGATIRRTGAGNYRLLLASTPDFVATPRVELRELTISGGRLAGNNQHGAGLGGFLADIVLDRVIVTANTTVAGRGGGAAIIGGSIDADRAVFASNSAVFGGGLSTSATSGSNDLRRTSFFFNAATTNSAAALLENGATLLENSTIAANSAPNGSGGVSAFTSAAATPATVTVRSSTLGDNGVAGSAAPGTSLWAIGSAGPATIHATDTVVSDSEPNQAPVSAACVETGAGAVDDGGGNVEWPGSSCGFGTQANPRLQYRFGGFGGAELFARILPGSAAIDNGGEDCPAIDQRGLPRPGGDACDSGSWETHPPQTTAQGPSGPTSDPRVTFESSEPGSTFECRVDGGEWQACTSPFDPGDLDDGSHTVEVRAIDQDGEVDPSPASATFVVDTAPPETTITSGPSGTHHHPSATFGFTSDDPAATFECRLDGGSWSACTSPRTVSGYAEGTHTFEVRARDQAGNADPTPASRTFTYRRCDVVRAVVVLGRPTVICV